MKRPPLKTIVFFLFAGLAVAGLASFFASRRQPACSGEGKYMSTTSECRAWGFDEPACASVVEKARVIAAAKSPKFDDQFQCELRFSDCVGAPGGGFIPKPSFCMKAPAAEPTEIRYLQYDSDRNNRKKAREVRID